MTDNILNISDLCATVGSFSLKNIHLTMQKGAIMGLIGKNGAGKTTLINTILGQLPAWQGQVLFDGLELYNHEPQVISQIGVAFDNLVYPTSMKANRIARMFAPFYEHFDLEYFHALMERFGLSEQKRLSSYSKGMQNIFSLIMAICHHPRLLILDEPTTGLDPSARIKVLDLLLEFMLEEGKSVLFSTHITNDLDRIADYITLIDQGEILFSSLKDSLLDQYAVVNIEEAAFTDEMNSNLSGLKKNLFGYEGLSRDKSLFLGIDGVKLARPTVEDLILYQERTEGSVQPCKN